jgi:hypothetical protein
MFKGFINYDEYINDTIHRVLFDFETGDVIVASKNFEETKAKGAKDINFNTFFPNYIYKDIKDKVVKAKEGHIMTTLEYRGQKMPFKFELIEFEDKQTIAGSLIVDGLTLGSFREKFKDYTILHQHQVTILITHLQLMQVQVCLILLN